MTVSNTNGCTFSRMRNSNNNYITVSNCYYIETVGTAQGKQLYTISTESPVTVTMVGTATEYTVSGITAYADNSGLLYNDGIIAGDGDSVALSLSGSSSGVYEADYGTLTVSGENFILAMTANNTTISAVSCPAPYNVTVPEATLEARYAYVAWEGTSSRYDVEYREVITPAVDLNVTYDFEDGQQGWTTIDADGHGDAWSLSTSDGNNGAACMKAAYNYNYDQQDYLVSPQVTLGGTLSFYAKRYSGNGDDKFRVYLSTTGNTNASDFTIELTDGDVTPTSSYTQYTYDLSSYSGLGYIAIVYTAPANQWYLYVDDITITASVEGEYGEWQVEEADDNPQMIYVLTPETTYEVSVKGYCGGEQSDYSETVTFTTPAVCPALTGLAVGRVTGHGASFTWDNTDAAVCQYGVALAGTPEEDYVYSGTTQLGSATISNLEPETDYVFALRRWCNTEGVSVVSTVNFTTLEACPAPTTLTVTATTATTATLSWTESGEATAWQICLNDDEENLIDADENPFTITGLTASTSYTVKVRANCGGSDGESDWSNR